MMPRIGQRSAPVERQRRRKVTHPAKGQPVPSVTRQDLDKVSKRVEALEKKPEVDRGPQ